MRPALNKAKEILGDIGVTGVEVGVLRGECSREILREWGKCSMLYLVDNYACGMGELVTAKSNLAPWSLRFDWRIGDSVAMAQEIPDGLDFVYVDGDHSYDGVKRDMEAYWPKLRSGGVLCGHDYNPRWESMKGIIRAVDEFAVKQNVELWTETSGSSSDWVLVKP